MSTLDDIKNILKNLPTNILLTQYGNELGRNSLIRNPTVQKDDIEANAAVFDLKRIESAIQEIGQMFKDSRTKNPVSSYGMKHWLEDAGGSYITNGDFIMAMILSGYKLYWGAKVTYTNPFIFAKLRKKFYER
ncbi:hypothetical protein HK097_007367 [Rhizophlyctis rosea]|uniref:Uncharacterized protein n=1 Tax=Rhizophlyctis rosea TaxID=64517 RepID=A0AAD5SD45_9FUNG|nr:hypothetical protein HK097_007367 [Rhizophlyctis rosea]